ncbi:hypothetical protein [Mycoplasma miroungirhinis]|uniref:Uncharacterized protein n=1 Tax=Mycoplasma miroungirhinis TaxID=754516 RepID=A0A6M4JG59_9MOLU|nr:hypothetical protein [Mycoplasma miroungirhinis]QJR44022.1 hypothetical protein HLA92_01035 [Mycoplasma miroungirhinis]
MISRKKYWQEYRDELKSLISIQNNIKKENKNFNKKSQQILNNIPDHKKMLDELNNQLNLNFFPFEYNLDKESIFLDDIKITYSTKKITELSNQINDILNHPLNKKDFLIKVKNLVLNNEIVEIQNDLNKELQNIKRGIEYDKKTN